MPSYFELEDHERRNLLNASARMTGKAPSTLEKDIWLCHVLDQLFQHTGVCPMVFKGGTSLSKVFGVIERFSEDIDVTIDWRQIHPKPPTSDELAAMSKAQTRKLSEVIEGHLLARVKTLKELLSASLGPKLEVAYEKNADDSDAMDKLRVVYPALVEYQDKYVQPSVLIEFGARNDIVPGDQYTIAPDVLPLFPEIHFPQATIGVLSPERTYWEKATLMHDECQRPADKPRISSARLSRHWYDLAQLANHNVGHEALRNPSLLEQVVDTKNRFFRYAFSDYGKCLTGHMQLVPDAAILAGLKEDYGVMESSGMFYGDHPSFEDIVDRLRALELEINAAIPTQLAASASTEKPTA